MPSRRIRRPAAIVACALAAARVGCGDDPVSPTLPAPFDVLEVRVAVDLPTFTAGGGGTTVSYIFTNRTDADIPLSDPTGCLRYVPAAATDAGIYRLSRNCEPTGREVPVRAHSSTVVTLPFNGVLSLGTGSCELTGRVRLVGLVAGPQGVSSMMLPTRPGSRTIAEAPVTVDGTGERPACPSLDTAGARLAGA